MIKSDQRAFAELWVMAHEAVGKKATPAAITFSYEILVRFEYSDIHAAIVRHMNNPDAGMFAPKPADIVRQIEGTGDEVSLQAWTRVEAAVSSYGSWTPLVFDDARIHAVIGEMGGWSKFCEMSYTELPFIRNEFCKRYRSYMQIAPSNYPKTLVADGNGNPRFLGSYDNALEVMNGGSLAYKENAAGLSHVGKMLEQFKESQ